jgi:beta-lactamase regulating signal transducer with metallopeptidase domain
MTTLAVIPLDWADRTVLGLVAALIVFGVAPLLAALVIRWFVAPRRRLAAISTVTWISLVSVSAAPWFLDAFITTRGGRLMLTNWRREAMVDTLEGRLRPALAAFGSESAPATGTTLALTLAGLWGIGAAGGVLRLGAGWIRLRRWRREAAPAGPNECRLLADLEARRELGPSAIELRISDSVSSAITFGWWRPVILLPRSAAGWSLAEMRMVLAHELDHVRRGDFARALAFAVLRSLLWFHPGAGELLRMARREMEFAGDDRAAGQGSAESWARCLARLATDPAPPRLALGVGGELTRRVGRLLGRRARVGVSVGLLMAPLTLACGTSLAVRASATPPAATLQALELCCPCSVR